MTALHPTDEQQKAIDLFATGRHLVIEAGAGTGKTSTLTLLAGTTGRFGQYIAFNKAIVEDSRSKFPRSVVANTAHSLAYRAMGWRFATRLRSAQRMTGREMAARLGLRGISVEDPNKAQPRELSAGFLASLCNRAVGTFCQSDAVQISTHHFPYIEGIDAPDNGKRTYVKNERVRRHLLPFAEVLWDDLQRLDGWAPYRHDHYLKAWQLSGPRIATDYILFDEAQDANPVIAAIVAAQNHAQLIYVGDSQQAIYEWTGAVNAMEQLTASDQTFLTQSFRFGPPIADYANIVLESLHAPLRLSGNIKRSSTVGPVAQPSAILTRTNATAVAQMIASQANGEAVHLVGGGGDIVAFAQASTELVATGRTPYADLACFGSWPEVQSYAKSDPEGEDLLLRVNLIDKFGAGVIVAAIGRAVTEDRADLILSTAHRAKGREWSSVRLADDFRPKPDAPPSELRLRYVAVTRARDALDATILEQEVPR